MPWRSISKSSLLGAPLCVHEWIEREGFPMARASAWGLNPALPLTSWLPLGKSLEPHISGCFMLLALTTGRTKQQSGA